MMNGYVVFSDRFRVLPSYKRKDLPKTNLPSLQINRDGSEI